MKIFDLFKLYFNNRGFLAPLEDIMDKKDLTFIQEKLISKINSRIVRCIDIIVQIHKMESAAKDQTLNNRTDLYIRGLHCDLFTTSSSIYSCAYELFNIHTGSKVDEITFWKGKYNLDLEDKVTLSKPQLKDLLLIINSLISPINYLRTYGESGDEIMFQCYDMDINELIEASVFSNSQGLIRTKFFAQLMLMDMLNYLVTLGKYMCKDLFGGSFESKDRIIQVDMGMKAFLEIGEELMNMEV
jgi:hypothetical protein